MDGYNLADLTFSPCWLFKLPPSIVINCTTGKNYCLFNRLFFPPNIFEVSQGWPPTGDGYHGKGNLTYYIKGDTSLQEDRGCFSLNTSEGGSPVPGGGDIGLYATALMPPTIPVLCSFHPDLYSTLYWTVPIWVQTLIFYSQGIAKIRPSHLPRSCWTSRRDLQPNVWFISAAAWGGSYPGHQAPSPSYLPFLAAPCLQNPGVADPTPPRVPLSTPTFLGSRSPCLKCHLHCPPFLPTLWHWKCGNIWRPPKWE